MRSARKRTAERSGTRIRLSAAELFAVRGFAATSVRDIARGSDLSPSAIYNHFDSKEAILSEIAVENHQKLYDALTCVAEGRPRASDRLDALVAVLTRHCVETSLEMHVSEREYAHLPEPARTRVVELRKASLGLFESALQAGVAAGELDLPSQADHAVLLVAKSIVNQIVANAGWYVSDAQLESEQIVGIQRELVRRMTRRPRGA